MKVLRVRCTPVTDISKEIVMAQNKRYLAVRDRDQDWSWWSVDPNHFDVPADWFQPLFEQLFWTVSKTSISFKKKLKIAAPYERYNLSFSNSLCFFQKYNEVWKQKFKITWGTHMELVALITQNRYKTSKILWKSGLVLHMKAIYVTIYKLTVTRYIQANKKFNLIIIVNSSSFWY